MADHDDVRRIAEGLPHGSYDADSHSCVVADTPFAWPWRERVHPKRTKVLRTDVLVVRCDGEDDKQALLAAPRTRCSRSPTTSDTRWCSCGWRR